MEEISKYHINFFRPHTPFLKDNIRLIVIAVVIWAVAVFGFHLLLKVVESPVPEPGYTTYKQVWDKQLSASADEKKELAKVYLTLVGKYIPLRKNADVQGDFSRLVYDLMPPEAQAGFAQAVSATETVPSVDVKQIAAMLGIQGSLLQEAIPFALGQVNMGDSLSAAIPGIMDKYLIHNRSFLTDTTFLGFPLHYFYTAIFLKVLFCLICLVYCKAIDKIMKKHGMESENE